MMVENLFSASSELVLILDRTRWSNTNIALEAKVRTLLNAEIQSGITSDFLLTRSAILRLLYIND
ncbi:MAG: hypothetical protein MGF17_05135 [Trichodesmium sp. MAG_R04]|nr:hypothetical protein [Trichodesmium sp. MAG_R04]